MRAAGLGLGVVALGLAAWGCDPVVATLPADRAQRVMRAMDQVQLAAQARRVGDAVAISVARRDQHYARAIVGAVDRPRAPDPPPRLVHGPTEAKLAARARDRRHLEAAIGAMPAVVEARVAIIDEVPVAVLTTRPDPGDTARRARALLGPGARVHVEPLPARGSPSAASLDSAPRQPSVALSAAVALLSLLVLGLLAHVRRLRRSLGR